MMMVTKMNQSPTPKTKFLKLLFWVKNYLLYFIIRILGYKFVQAIDENLKRQVYLLRYEVCAGQGILNVATKSATRS